MAKPEPKKQTFDDCEFFVDNGETAEEIEVRGTIFCEKHGSVAWDYCLTCKDFEEW